jgi:hypothetical protein
MSPAESNLLQIACALVELTACHSIFQAIQEDAHSLSFVRNLYTTASLNKRQKCMDLSEQVKLPASHE